MRAFDRRDFIGLGGKVAAGLSAAALAAKTEVFADVVKPVKDNANEKLRVAVIGAGTRGPDHIAGLAGQHNCVVATLCDCDEDRIGKCMTLAEKQQNQAPKYEKDIRRVIDDPSIDIITIAMPNHWHALAAIWAMRAGKDVYVEKPVSHNVWEGRKIVEAARKYNRICQTGTQSRSMAGLREAMAFLHEGKLGAVNRVYGLCYKPRGSIGKVQGEGKIPANCDYDLWCGPAPKEPLHRTKLHYDWHWQWDCGNGDLGNQGIHQVDIGRWGLHKNTMPNSVVSYGGRFGYQDDGQTANTQVIFYDYGDCDMVFEVRGLKTPDFLADRGKPTEDKRQQAHVGMVFYAKDGMMVVTSYTNAIAVSNDGEVLKVFSTPKDQHMGHYANFVQAVRSRKNGELRGEIAEGHLSSSLCHLGNISYRLGQEVPFSNSAPASIKAADAGEIYTRMKKHLQANQVKLDSVMCRVGKPLTLDVANEKFVGDAAANTMLKREYRKGFEITENM